MNIKQLGIMTLASCAVLFSCNKEVSITRAQAIEWAKENFKLPADSEEGYEESLKKIVESFNGIDLSWTVSSASVLEKSYEMLKVIIPFSNHKEYTTAATLPLSGSIKVVDLDKFKVDAETPAVIGELYIPCKQIDSQFDEDTAYYKSGDTLILKTVKDGAALQLNVDKTGRYTYASMEGSEKGATMKMSGKFSWNAIK